MLNKGWNQAEGEWKQAEGKAYFVEQPDKGRLKVSFFGPFYGGYNIIELDKKEYAYSMVTGPDKSYLWILSRTRQLPKATLETLIAKAKQLGFATDELIFVKNRVSLSIPPCIALVLINGLAEYQLCHETNLQRPHQTVSLTRQYLFYRIPEQANINYPALSRVPAKILLRRIDPQHHKFPAR